MAIGVPLGRVRVQYVAYETRAELLATLIDLQQKDELGLLGDDQVIVLAIPATLRKLMTWPATGVPRPEIYTDVLAFQRPKG